MHTNPNQGTVVVEGRDGSLECVITIGVPLNLRRLSN
jgi:hypothetical protein